MDRKEFLSSLGFTAFAVCAGSCFSSCSKSSGSPQGPSGVNFTVDLKTQILNVKDSTSKSGVIVVRLAAGNDPASFTAVAQACTHQGTPVNFDRSIDLFVCPLHGSEFNTNGGVVLGPASASLKKYGISISADTMTVAG